MSHCSGEALPLSCCSPRLQARLVVAPWASTPAFPSTPRVGLTPASPHSGSSVATMNLRLLPSPSTPTPPQPQPAPLTAQPHGLPCHVWVPAETGQGHSRLLLDSLAGRHLSRGPRSWLLGQHAHDKLYPWAGGNE